MMTSSLGSTRPQAFPPPPPAWARAGRCKPSPSAPAVLRNDRRESALTSSSWPQRDPPVARARMLSQQRHRGEDLPALAVAALRHLLIDPCLLHRVKPFALREALDGDHAPAGDLGERQRARARRLAVAEHQIGRASWRG